jgi:hypothetical protein
MLEAAGLRLPLLAQEPAAPVAADPQAVPTEPGWTPQNAAVLRALNKIDATTSVLTIKVGASTQFGSLTIGVQSCVVRPPRTVPDAAAYVVISDAHADEPGFRGWILANEPWLSMLQHPVYDVRIVGCRP